jgi:molybdopterin converting factor small subunit
MVISIELFGMQREIAGIDKIIMPITGKTLVRDALEYLNQNHPILSLDKESIFVTVNHESSLLDRPLNADDVVCIMPHIGGG